MHVAAHLEAEAGGDLHQFDAARVVVAQLGDRLLEAARRRRLDTRGPSVTLHLHHAGDLDVLLDALAEILAAPVDDPFRPDLVVVPAIGMQDAVMAGFGRRLGVTDPALGDGIVANVEFAFPGRVLARALGYAVA